MASNHVKEWQTRLNLEADGDFGPLTLARSIEMLDKAERNDPVKPPVTVSLVTGKMLVDLAKTRLGEKYVYGANVPLNDPDWHGPWDCAEFCSWTAYQLLGEVYGCVNNNADDPEPYTGGWKQDVLSGRVIKTAVSHAAVTPGAILLRYRQNGKHIVFAAGNGATIEAKSAEYGVCKGAVGNLASWDYGILLPGVKY